MKKTLILFFLLSFFCVSYSQVPKSTAKYLQGILRVNKDGYKCDGIRLFLDSKGMIVFDMTEISPASNSLVVPSVMTIDENGKVINSPKGLSGEELEILAGYYKDEFQIIRRIIMIAVLMGEIQTSDNSEVAVIKFFIDAKSDSDYFLLENEEFYTHVVQYLLYKNKISMVGEIFKGAIFEVTSTGSFLKNQYGVKLKI